MKQPRRWAAWLAAMLIAASMVAIPREGAVAGPFIDGNPPVIDEGDPDGPTPTALYVSRNMHAWALGVVFQQGRLFMYLRPIFDSRSSNQFSRTQLRVKQK